MTVADEVDGVVLKIQGAPSHTVAPSTSLGSSKPEFAILAVALAVEVGVGVEDVGASGVEVADPEGVTGTHGFA